MNGLTPKCLASSERKNILFGTGTENCKQSLPFGVNKWLSTGFSKLDLSLRNLKDKQLLYVFLYGSDKYVDTLNKEIIVHKTIYLKNTKHLERPQFDRRFTFLLSFSEILIRNAGHSISYPSIPIFYQIILLDFATE